MQIINFAQQAKKMEEFLIRFKHHIDLMELEYDQTLHDSKNMNNMLITYEESLISNYGDGYRKSKVTNAQKNNLLVDDDHYMIFDQVQNADMRTELSEM